jgi:hypothetical protein
MNERLFAVTLAGSLLATGCGSSLQLKLVRAAQYKSGNVAMFFSVKTSTGGAVTNLIADDFSIYEDGRLVSVEEARRTVINPEVATGQYALLLIDMSGSITERDQLLYVVRLVQEFVAQVGQLQKVAIFAFDGSRDIYEITPFTNSQNDLWRGLTALQEFRSRDPSTNLYGAVVRATEKLNAVLKSSGAPAYYGTLVVFTDGTDQAARVSSDRMLKVLSSSGVTRFAIGIGDKTDNETLERIGSDQYIHVQDNKALALAFREIGIRVLTNSHQYYLVTYCSPARSGKHEVTVTASGKDARGELKYTFDARGFRTGCDPTALPPFNISAVSKQVLKKSSKAGKSVKASGKARRKAKVRGGS